jgi:seryl-tRNA(Sec) selenium transferase
MALPNLRSNVKPHELLEKQPEPRVLRVSKEDITALAQVIKEFQEQLEYYK